MASGIGSNSGISLLTSITRGGGSAGSFLAGQGANTLLNNSISNINSINQAREQSRNGGGGFGSVDATQALFGDTTNNIFSSLSFASQARIGQVLGQSAPSNADDREQLTQRLSQLSLDRLAVLSNAVSDDPEVDVPPELRRSLQNLSDRDRLTFRLAVDDAIEIVAARESQGGGSSSGGSLFNFEA